MTEFCLEFLVLAKSKVTSEQIVKREGPLSQDVKIELYYPMEAWSIHKRALQEPLCYK